MIAALLHLRGRALRQPAAETPEIPEDARMHVTPPDRNSRAGAGRPGRATAGRTVPRLKVCLLGGLALALHALPALAQAGEPQTWYDPERAGAPLVVFVVFSALVLFFIARSRRGSTLFIREIAGIGAMEEAVGRATELGKKVLFMTGGASIDDNQTIAGLAVLRHVARLTAQYGVDLEVPSKDPLTFAAARETVQEAYMEAGRPDLFTPQTVNYVTYDQFAYTASVTGLMVREKPAANFLIGAFHAESLLLAETGQMTGAIQIAGTAEVTQLPFFAVVCDYTLMGEELYAAGAYLSLEIFGVHWLKAFMTLE
jgi:hypothetical protein